MEIEKKHYTFFKYFFVLRTHFDHNNDYCFFKYNGKTKNTTLKDFENKTDAFKYISLKNKLDKHGIDQVKFLIINFFYMDNPWIGDFKNLKRPVENYYKFRAYLEAMEYTFRNEFKKILKVSDKKPFESVDGKTPLICDMVMRGDIHPITFIILNKELDLLNSINGEKFEDILWPPFEYKLRQLAMFIPVREKNFKEIIKEELNEYMVYV